MRKKNTFLVETLAALALVFCFTGLSAQNTMVKFDNNWGRQGITLKAQSPEGVLINASINTYGITNTMVDNIDMKTITTVGVLLQNNEGAPNVPSYSNYIAVPQGAKVIAKVIRKKSETVNNISIAPAPIIPKDDDNSPLKFTFDKKIYSSDQLYPKNIVSISKPMKIRGVDVVLVAINPFQYNPVTKQMVVNRDIEVEISFEGGNGHFGEDRLRSRWWDPIIRDEILNEASIQKANHSSRNTNETGYEYLIIVPDDASFISWADSLKNFRIQQGISTNVVTTTEIGGNTVSAIEGYIDNAYYNWDIPPAAVLLMADYGTSGNTIISPIYNNYCVSDNIFADVDGDQLPDIIFARMTAQNEEHLQTYVTKVLNYERNPPVNPNFYNHPITALGWQTERWFQICSETVSGFFKNVLGKDPVRVNAVYIGNPNSDPWSTATNTNAVIAEFGPDGLGYIPATPAELGGWTGGNATEVNNAINSGAFILQHRDHGGTDGWGEPNYSNNNINGLTNTDLTFIFSINCLTGKYNISGECFAEKFHRYKYNGANSGALGLIAASEVSYSFVNDTYAWGMYDNMWPQFLPEFGTTPDTRGILPAFGNAAGKYFLEQSSWPYNTNNKEVTYNLFHDHGDAFSVIYSEIPQYLTVIHDSILIAGVTSFTITADTGSFIALTVNNQIIGTADGTGEPVLINITAQMPPDNIVVTVTKQNYYRYKALVRIIPPSGPFVIYDSLAIDGNNIMETGESILASVTVKNIGIEQADNVNVILSTVDNFIVMTDDSENYGNISSGSTSVVPDGFAWQVANNIPDMHNVMFDVESTDGTDIWTSTMNIVGHAPQLRTGNISINDVDQGNGNGHLDPGETVNISIETYNDGSVIAANTEGILSSSSTYVTVNSNNFNIGNIESDTMGIATFSVTIAQGTPIGETIDFIFQAQSGEYSAQNVFYQACGLIVEDWESGDMSQFNWETGGDANWQISTSNPFEGIYCSMSGNISDSQESWLLINYEVMDDDSISFYVKVSSEASYDFLKFYIDGQLIANLSGEVPWTYVTTAVSAGAHTFKWEYKKDMSVSSGDDGAIIDYIVLPVPPVTSVFAGADANFCESDIIACQGIATYIDSTVWATSGTGIFNDDHILSPIYQPSNEDISSGIVTLTLTGFGPVETVSDDVVFAIGSTPTAFSGTNSTTCSSEPAILNEANAENYTSILWTTSGDGTFNDTTAVNPSYTPGSADIENGTTTLTITAVGVEACGSAISELELIVEKATEANAGADADICSMLTYTLSDAVAANFLKILWTTTGDGNFDDSTNLNPTYFPGENDKITKEATLTLTATGAGICPVAVDDMLLTLNCTGIDDISNSVGIEVYPNPTNGTFTLKLNGVANDIAVFTIYSATGDIVYRIPNVKLSNNYSDDVNLDVLPGIYTIRIDGNTTHATQKFIVK